MFPYRLRCGRGYVEERKIMVGYMHVVKTVNG